MGSNVRIWSRILAPTFTTKFAISHISSWISIGANIHDSSWISSLILVNIFTIKFATPQSQSWISAPIFMTKLTNRREYWRRYSWFAMSLQGHHKKTHKRVLSLPSFFISKRVHNSVCKVVDYGPSQNTRPYEAPKEMNHCYYPPPALFCKRRKRSTDLQHLKAMDSFGTWRKWKLIFFFVNTAFYRVVWTINALLLVRSKMLKFSGNNQNINWSWIFSESPRTLCHRLCT